MTSNRNRCSREIAATIATLICATSASMAGSIEGAVEAGWSGSIGSGAVNQATYPGSPHRRTTGMPLVQLNWTTAHYGSFRLDQQGASWIFPQVAGLNAGVLVAADGGRYEDRHGGIFPYGDKRLDGMGDVRSSAEAGVSLGYRLVSLSVRQGLAARGHDGLIVDIGVEHGMQMNPRIGVSFSAGARWSDRRYMQSYFGVTEDQAAASRFNAYAAGSGLNTAQLSASAQFRLMRGWSAVAGLSYSRLLGDAQGSPVTERDGSATFLAGIAWNFD